MAHTLLVQNSTTMLLDEICIYLLLKCLDISDIYALLFKIKCNMLSLKYQSYLASALTFICSIFNTMDIIFNRLNIFKKSVEVSEEQRITHHPESQG